MSSNAARGIPWRIPAGPGTLSTLGVVLGVAILMGFLVARSLPAAFALAITPVIPAVLESARGRLLIVVFGGLLVFDSSSGFSGPKVVYAACLVACVAIAWQGSIATMRSGRAAEVRRLAGRACGVMTLVVAAALPVALLNGHSPSLWLRDVAPYIILGVVPILALDAAKKTTARFLAGTLVVAGMLVALSVAVQLISLRGLSSAALEELAILTGFLLPVILFTYACARTIYPRGGGREVLFWSVVAGTIFAALVISGTRASLFLLAVPVAMPLVDGGLSGFRRVVVLVMVAAGMLALVFSIAASAGIATQEITERFQSAVPAVRAPQENGSLSERFIESRVSWEDWQTAPVTGVGPGHVFAWTNDTGAFRRSFTVDSSVSTLAKFGLIGTAGLFVCLVIIARLAYGAGEARGKAALVGLTVWIAAYVVIGNPFEDKGFALGLILLLALSLSESAPFHTRGIANVTPEPAAAAVMR